MTIALGILSRDWMVIAADTEITAGDSKAHGEKVYWAMDDPKDPDAGILAVTGAGDLAHLEAAYLELKELFRAPFGWCSRAWNALQEINKGVSSRLHRSVCAVQ